MGAACPPHSSQALCLPRLGPLPLLSAHYYTDQVHQLLVADLAPLVALGQGHQHVQLGRVQGQLMAVHQAGEGVRTDETCVLRVQLLGGGGIGQGLRVGQASRPQGWARPAGRGRLQAPWGQTSVCTRSQELPGYQCLGPRPPALRDFPTSFLPCPSS